MKDDTQPVGDDVAEPFLERWSRRKVQARAGEAPPPEPGGDAAREDAAPDQPSDVVVPALPDLDTLDEGSDYSAFLGAGVDESLRRKALRRLFHSPKFNVCDGLDDYCDDFTRFEKLGSLVTADMRHQLERAAERLEQLADSRESRGRGEERSTQTEEPDAAEPTDDDRIEPA